MKVMNISEAKASLSKLVERVLQGEEVIIGKAGKPVAKLVPFDLDTRPRWRPSPAVITCEVALPLMLRGEHLLIVELTDGTHEHDRRFVERVGF